MLKAHRPNCQIGLEGKEVRRKDAPPARARERERERERERGGCAESRALFFGLYMQRKETTKFGAHCTRTVVVLQRIFTPGKESSQSNSGEVLILVSA
jgi:hypothetical protein